MAPLQATRLASNRSAAVCANGGWWAGEVLRGVHGGASSPVGFEHQHPGRQSVFLSIYRNDPRPRNPGMITSASTVDAPPGHGDQDYARCHNEHPHGGAQQPEAYDEHGSSRGCVLGAQEDQQCLCERERDRGRPRLHFLREILDAVFYTARSGCAWRLFAQFF